MPFLLSDGNQKAIHSHMPRTAGSNLREALKNGGCSVETINGYSGHASVDVLGGSLAELPVVTTVRLDREAWRRSVYLYLKNRVRSELAREFQYTKGPHVADHPTLELWEPTRYYERHIRSNRGTWYEQWIEFFVRPADVLVPFGALDKSEPYVTLNTLLNKSTLYL